MPWGRHSCAALSPGHCALGTFCLRRVSARRTWERHNAVGCFRCEMIMVPILGGDRVSCFGECGVTNMCLVCWKAATPPLPALPPCPCCGGDLEHRVSTNLGGGLLVYLGPDVVVAPDVGGAGPSAADGEAVGEAGASGGAGPSQGVTEE